jgi:hypothetical protein
VYNKNRKKLQARSDSAGERLPEEEEERRASWAAVIQK